MRPTQHLIAGVGLGVFAYQITHHWQWSVISAFTEVFLDIDHMLEHFLWSKRPLCLRTFLRSYNTFRWPRMVFVFHSYEFISLLIIAARYFANPFLWAVVFGAVAHMIMDEFGNRLPFIYGRLSPIFYFFFYRVMKRFRTEAMVTFPEGKPVFGENKEVNAWPNIQKRRN